MKFIPINLKKNPNEIHSYFESNKKIKIANYFHWKAIKYAASLVEPSGGTVAEIGCGEGYLMPTLRKHFDKVVGIDISERMLNSTKTFFQFPNVLYLKDNIVSPRYSDLIKKRYNWVICLETLEHVPQWDMALHNMFKMLLPAGRILISIPIEIRFPLLIKEVARYFSYGKGSGWQLDDFIKKVRGSRSPINRKNYGSHMGFDYRGVIDYIKKISYININHISFYPINSKYLGLRVYIVAQKNKVD